MSMSKRDFELIAETLRAALQEHDVTFSPAENNVRLVDALADTFGTLAPRFDRTRFVDACNVRMTRKVDDAGMFAVTLRHDDGVVTLSTYGENRAEVARRICTIERAPRRAVVSVRRVTA